MTRKYQLWLVLFPFIVLVGLFVRGQLRPVTEPDSRYYVEFDWSSWTSILNSTRTFGYPAFLRAAALLGAENAAVPFLQWLAAMCAAWLVYWGLLRAGYRVTIAFWCAIVLMLNRQMIDSVHLVMADSLATSMAIASVACFFAITAKSDNALAWCGLAIFTFAAYQVRPAYLFLVPFWPLTVLVSDVLLVRRGSSFATLAKRATLAALLIIVPFVGFCTLRWCTVGHWGLVSFGGYNVIGIAGQFLDRQLANELPETVRPLALRLAEEKEKLGLNTGAIDFDSMEKGYNILVWRIAVPAAEEIYENDSVAINRNLSQLSNAIIQRRKATFVKWLFINVKHAVSEMLQLTIRDGGTLLILLITGLLHLHSLVFGTNRTAEVSRAAPEETIRIEAHLVFWTALGFATAKAMLVVMVEPSVSRYMTSAIALLPVAVAAIAGQYICRRKYS